MHIHPELMQAICEQPRDSAVRLVYADWLEERGDPRAEFIRVQVALASLPDEDPKRVELAAREQALLRECGERWMLPRWPGIVWGEYERGFVSSLEAQSWQVLEDQLEEIFAVAPITRLRIRDRLPLDAVQAFVQSKYFSRLDAIDLRDTGLDPTGIQIFASAIGLRSIRWLNLGVNRLGDLGAQELVSSPHLVQLERLDLGTNRIGPSGAAALAVAAHMQKLEKLDLWHNDLGPLGARRLAESAFFRRLTTLDLDSNAIGALGAEALSDSPHLAKLMWLDLRRNSLHDAGATALVRSPFLQQIKVLDLRQNGITTLVGKRLTERFGSKVLY